ncbi:MAG: hypothetical protein ACKVWR_18305 [Acidimicrobiales bacterium]
MPLDAGRRSRIPRCGDSCPEGRGVVFGVALKAVGAVPAKRKEWYEGSGQRLDNTSKELEKRKRELEVGLKQLEFDAARDEAELRSELIRRLRDAMPDGRISNEELAALVEEHVLPSVRALGEIGIESLSEDESDADQDGPSC